MALANRRAAVLRGRLRGTGRPWRTRDWHHPRRGRAQRPGRVRTAPRRPEQGPRWLPTTRAPASVSGAQRGVRRRRWCTQWGARELGGRGTATVAGAPPGGHGERRERQSRERARAGVAEGDAESERGELGVLKKPEAGAARHGRAQRHSATRTTPLCVHMARAGHGRRQWPSAPLGSNLQRIWSSCGAHIQYKNLLHGSLSNFG